MRLRHTVIAAVALLAVAPVAWAQGAGGPVSRADVSGTLGWLNANKTELDGFSGSNDWYNRSLYGGAGLGWYWTDHWKTQIEGGLSSSAELRVYSQALIDGRTASLSSNYTFVTRRLAIGQQYQFFRNQWVHPFAGVGLDLTWEQTDRTDEIYWSLPVRTTAYPRRTELLTRPFATFGVKAYITPRAFVRTDMKLVFDKGVDEALLRFGIGVDF
jgi:outer membrane protein with beta-barrel domain